LPLARPLIQKSLQRGFFDFKERNVMAILLFISIGFTLYFRLIEMRGAAIGAFCVIALILVIWSLQ